MPEAMFPADAMREQRRRTDEYRRRCIALDDRCKALEAALTARGIDPAAIVAAQPTAELQTRRS